MAQLRSDTVIARTDGSGVRNLNTYLDKIDAATSTATPNTIVQRDPDGRFKAAAPSDPDDVARKAEVDAITSEKVNVLPENYKVANDSGSDYPSGVTAFSVTGGNERGWPSDSGIVLNAKLSGNRFLQIYQSTANNNTFNGRVYVRTWRQADRGWSDFRRVWDSQEMGAESGLDADLLDGLHASSFWTKSEIPYETGTWTPELWFGSSNSGITYSMRTGRYTRIGNIVYFTFRLDLTSKGSASGGASITGLPFTSMSGNEHAAFAIGMLNPINMPSNAFWVHGIILNSSNQILIRASGNLGGSVSLNASNFSDNTAIRAEGFYFIP